MNLYRLPLLRDMRKIAFGEKLVLPNYKAYAVMLRKAYEARPVREAGVESSWQALNAHNHKMFKQLQSRVRVEWVDYDPYKNAAHMTAEVKKTGVMKIWTGASKHPVFSEKDTWIFRAVHDYIVHIGGKHPFTLRGELSSYNRHAKLLPPKALPALFTEICGQVGYAIDAGNFPQQKVALLYGFDYLKVGKIDQTEYQKNFDKHEKFVMPPKNKYVQVDDRDREDISQVLFDLIRNAYKDIGGNVKFPDQKSVAAGGNTDQWNVADTDKDPELDVTYFGKTTKHGTKYTGIGHDGDRSNVVKLIRQQVSKLKKPGNYAEVSGKVFTAFVVKGGAPIISDPEVVKKVLGSTKARQMEWHGKHPTGDQPGDGWYTRPIGGKRLTKIMIGKIR